jgi:class 3 adenylate cyclase
LLSSKEVLEKTGISRATLNNYIASGIVPRPEVLPPGPQDGGAPRIGYFPPDIVARIEEIQRLKREGWSLTRITEHFTGGVAPARPAAAPQEPSSPLGRASPSPAPSTGEMPRLSFGEISHPAYLVNSRFELVWMNDAATSADWPNFVALPRAAVSQGIFQFLLQAGRGLGVSGPARAAILRLHLGLARQLGAGLAELARGIPPGELSTMERLYNETEPFEFPLVVRTPVTPAGAGPAAPLFLYALNFREGILFLYVPGGAGSVDMPGLLAEPAAKSEPRRAQPPALTQVAVLVTELQDAAGLWASLPPEEYFELINDIWQTVEPIFKRHGGTNGVHPGEGMVCYFLPRTGTNYLWNALMAAQEVREAMRRLGQDWELRKGWSTPLCLNTGIDEGLEWHGTLRRGSEGEFTVLGDAVNHAAGASILAHDGAIWATRNLVSKLRAEERRRLRYGVRRVSAEGRTEPVRSVYARVEDLADLGAPGNEALRAIAGLAITEIFDIAADADEAGPAGSRPTV